MTRASTRQIRQENFSANYDPTVTTPVGKKLNCSKSKIFARSVTVITAASAVSALVALYYYIKPNLIVHDAEITIMQNTLKCLKEGNLSNMAGCKNHIYCQEYDPVFAKKFANVDYRGQRYACINDENHFLFDKGSAQAIVNKYMEVPKVQRLFDQFYFKFFV
jgi:hypothetical protein